GDNRVVEVRHIHLQEVVDAYGWSRAKVLCPEVRRFLQYFGTEGVRNHLGKWTWVDLAEREVTNLWVDDLSNGRRRRNIVFSDVYFPEEREFVHANHGFIVKIERDDQSRASVGSDGHESWAG